MFKRNNKKIQKDPLGRNRGLNFSGDLSTGSISRIEKKPEIVQKTEHQKIRPHIDTRPLRSIFYLALFLAGIYLIFISNVFKITNVEIDGIKSVEISDYAKRTLYGQNIFLIRPGTYLDDLSAKFPILEQAGIVRGLPSTIKITAKERKQVMVWCSLNCYEVDNRGYVYQEVPRPLDLVVLLDGKNLPVKIGDQVTSPDVISFYLTAIDRIEELGLKVAEAGVDETTFKISFKTSENWSIIMDTSASLKNQISALSQTLEKTRADIHEYVDLRVEGLVYIK